MDSSYRPRRRRSGLPIWVWFLLVGVGLFGLLGYFVWEEKIHKPALAAARKREIEEKRAAAKAELEEDYIKPQTTGFAPQAVEKVVLKRPEEGASMADVIEYIEYGIVQIETRDPYNNRNALGSGFIIGEEGGAPIVATNYHVLRDGIHADVLFNRGERYGVEGYLAVSPETDLAIVKLNGAPANYTVLELVYEGLPRKLEQAYAIGHPHGHKFQATDGRVSGLQRTSELPGKSREFLESFLGDSVDHSWISHTAKISPGNSGGPLLNGRGQVLGVNTWVSYETDLGYASHALHLYELQQSITGEVTEMSEYYSPESQAVAEVDVEQEEVSEFIDDLTAQNWLPESKDDYEKMQSIALAVTFAGLGETTEKLIQALQAVEWTLDEHVETINGFAAPRLDEREGALFLATASDVTREDGATIVMMQLDGTEEKVGVIVQGVRSDLAAGKRYVVLGVTLGSAELEVEGEEEDRALIASRLVISTGT